MTQKNIISNILISIFCTSCLTTKNTHISNIKTETTQSGKVLYDIESGIQFKDWLVLSSKSSKDKRLLICPTCNHKLNKFVKQLDKYTSFVENKQHAPDYPPPLCSLRVPERYLEYFVSKKIGGTKNRLAWYWSWLKTTNLKT